ncbi:MAG: glycine betaine ABC transporter substrate-binding protein [Candidatus Izemoplasmataceae bacterium]
MKKLFALLLAALSAATLSACGDDENTIVIASKPMTEQYILTEMLAILVEDNTDLEVELEQGIGGGTSNIHPGMVEGDIDMYPEYTGTGWLDVLEEDLIDDPDELYENVKDAYEEEFGILWSGMYGFNNAFGLAVREETADEHDLSTYSDLAEVSDEMVFGAEADFYERDDGYEPLIETYDFEFEDTSELDIGLKYEAMGSKDIDVINIFTTDGRLEEFDLTVLEDDKQFFPTYYGATLVREEIVDEHPDIMDVVNMLEGQISDEAMTEMNYRVENDDEDPREVARDFLEEKGLR